jgi:hypothetical protein
MKGGPLGNLFLSEHFYNLFLSVDDYLWDAAFLLAGIKMISQDTDKCYTNTKSSIQNQTQKWR